MASASRVTIGRTATGSARARRTGSGTDRRRAHRSALRRAPDPFASDPLRSMSRGPTNRARNVRSSGSAGTASAPSSNCAYPRLPSGTNSFAGPVVSTRPRVKPNGSRYARHQFVSGLPYTRSPPSGRRPRRTCRPCPRRPRTSAGCTNSASRRRCVRRAETSSPHPSSGSRGRRSSMARDRRTRDRRTCEGDRRADRARRRQSRGAHGPGRLAFPWVPTPGAGPVSDRRASGRRRAASAGPPKACHESGERCHPMAPPRTPAHAIHSPAPPIHDGNRSTGLEPRRPERNRVA